MATRTKRKAQKMQKEVKKNVSADNETMPKQEDEALTSESSEQTEAVDLKQQQKGDTFAVGTETLGEAEQVPDKENDDMEQVAKKEETPRKRTSASPVKKAKVEEKMTEKIYVQMSGIEIEPDVIKKKAIDDFIANGHRIGMVEEFSLYIKPEEGKAYYVAKTKRSNFTGSVSLF